MAEKDDNRRGRIISFTGWLVAAFLLVLLIIFIWQEGPQRQAWQRAMQGAEASEKMYIELFEAELKRQAERPKLPRSLRGLGTLPNASEDNVSE